MLFINGGKRGFRNEASARGVAGNGTLEYGGVFADYDNDGDPDLYVTREGTDVLYRNNGKGRFTDVTVSAKVGGGNLSHRTASWADYDNDGRLDLYVTNHSFCYDPGQADQLFHQNRNGTFTDVSSLIQADYSLTPNLGQGRGFEAAWSTPTETAARTSSWRTISSSRTPTSTGCGETTGPAPTAAGVSPTSPCLRAWA